MTKSMPWLFLTLLLLPSSNPAPSMELSPNILSPPTQDSNGGRAQVWLPLQHGGRPLFPRDAAWPRVLPQTSLIADYLSTADTMFISCSVTLM